MVEGKILFFFKDILYSVSQGGFNQIVAICINSFKKNYFIQAKLKPNNSKIKCGFK